MDSNISWFAILFCCTLTIIGAFFLLNVILAVLADALNKADEVQATYDEEKRSLVAKSIKR